MTLFGFSKLESFPVKSNPAASRSSPSHTSGFTFAFSTSNTRTCARPISLIPPRIRLESKRALAQWGTTYTISRTDIALTGLFGCTGCMVVCELSSAQPTFGNAPRRTPTWAPNLALLRERPAVAGHVAFIEAELVAYFLLGCRALLEQIKDGCLNVGDAPQVSSRAVQFMQPVCVDLEVELLGPTEPSAQVQYTSIRLNIQHH